MASQISSELKTRLEWDTHFGLAHCFQIARHITDGYIRPIFEQLDNIKREPGYQQSEVEEHQRLDHVVSALLTKERMSLLGSLKLAYEWMGEGLEVPGEAALKRVENLKMLSPEKQKVTDSIKKQLKWPADQVSFEKLTVALEYLERDRIWSQDLASQKECFENLSNTIYNGAEARQEVRFVGCTDKNPDGQRLAEDDRQRATMKFSRPPMDLANFKSFKASGITKSTRVQ